MTDWFRGLPDIFASVHSYVAGARRCRYIVARLPGGNMRHALTVVVLLLVAAAASAEERRYAVLSMIGDQIELVTDSPLTGSNIPQSGRQTVKMPDASLDRFVLLTVDRIARSRSVPEIRMMAARDPALFALQ